MMTNSFNVLCQKFSRMSFASLWSIYCSIVILLAIPNYLFIKKQYHTITANPGRIVNIILIDLIILLVLSVALLVRMHRKDIKDPSKLRNRFVLAFSVIAALPTILVALFSSYIFNYSIQSWFDKKILTILDQSVLVGESYIYEHKMQLKKATYDMVQDLKDTQYDFIYDSAKFSEVLNVEAKIRSLDEAIVFQPTTHYIIAQTSLSFILSFSNIPPHLIEKASTGEIVEVDIDPKKIRMLVKLPNYSNTYLLTGRLIDDNIINHINKAEGTAVEYYRLKNQISTIQIKFLIAFILFALLLLSYTVSLGNLFASRIINPIKQLVDATDKVKEGNLTIQVQEYNEPDEIGILGIAFNRMIKQLASQKRDLAAAERAMAWSDVARRVAHEIKNPLTPIYLAAERLKKKFGAQVSDQIAFNKYIEIIANHTNDIKNIVGEFVNFARLPAPIFAECNIISLIKKIIDARGILNENIEYVFIEDVDEIKIVCDAAQINQIMLNLLKNAEEALAETRGARKIIVRIEYSAEQLVIEIIDNGSGFSDDLLSNATNAYITTKAKGTGLGLAIVKKIVQDHCGDIIISNNLEINGATIKLIFDNNKLKFKLSVTHNKA